MQRAPLAEHQQDRVAASLPFVESLARRMASTMPHSIDLGDLVQDGVLGLIDAAHRFDEDRGIKFETFAERRVRGAMIDALRRDAWPRGVRRVRRELEAAREELRRELGAEPTLADLARRVGADEARLERTIVRISTIESTSPLANFDTIDSATLPAVLVPSEPPSPDRSVRAARGPRPRAHRARPAAGARAPDHRPLLLWRGDDEADRQRDRRQRIARLAAPRARDSAPEEGARRRTPTPAAPRLVAKTRRPRDRRDRREADDGGGGIAPEVARARGAAEPEALTDCRVSSWNEATPALSAECRLRLIPSVSLATPARRSRSRNGFGIQRQPLSSRNRSASVPATSPVTKISRRAMCGMFADTSRKNVMPSTFGIFRSQMITS